MRPPERLLRIGTRGSPLALWQAEWVGAALAAARPGLRWETVKVRTLAEKFPDLEVPQIGVGIFTKELDEALRRGEVDIAVHSLKDVPSELAPDLVIAAVPERESPLDAFLSADGTRLEALPRGARIGTGSPRRKAQLLRLRPDLEVVPLRGNVATRLRKMEEQGLAGTILAHAGLKRLGEAGRITHVISPDVIVPAVSQGALCVVTLAANSEARALAGALEHAPTRTRITAERAFLRALRGGCQVPAGALAEIDGASLRIAGVVAAPDGSTAVRGEATGPASETEEIGARLAADLLARGGDAVLRGLGRE
jgi:hydroxymethylbilane synthase